MKLSEKAIEELDEIQSRYIEETKAVLIEQAKFHNPYKVGDIIEDHYQTGEIETVLISTNTDTRKYSVSYRCKRLTKKLTPYKGGESTIIWGGNVQKQIANY
jgi:hypothetical protein